MNHSRDKRQKTIPHPMPTPPPLSVHFEKYVSYIMLMGVAHSSRDCGLRSLVICFLSLIVLDYLTLQKFFKKLNTPHY